MIERNEFEARKLVNDVVAIGKKYAGRRTLIPPAAGVRTLRR